MRQRQHPQRHLVIGGEDRAGRRGQGQQRLARRDARCEIELAGHEQGLLRDDARHRQPFAKAIDPAQRGMVGGGRGDDADAAVAQPDQMIRHHPPRRLFGGRYGEAGRGGGAGDARAGQLHLRQPVE